MRIALVIIAASLFGFGCATQSGPSASGSQRLSRTDEALNLPPTSSAEQARTGAPLKAEFAWARARWPNELGHVEYLSHADLGAWVAPGAQLEVWFSADNLRCQRARMTRGQKPDDHDFRVYTAEKRVNGVATRSVLAETPQDGTMLWLHVGVFNERQQPNGTWQSVANSADLDADHPILVLTSVDEHVARFAGALVSIAVSCNGPTHRIACSDGGALDCDTCQRIALLIEERDVASLIHGPAPSSEGNRGEGDCACPEVSHPDIERAHRVFQGLDTFTTVRTPGRANASVYRTEKACQAEHAPPAASR